MHPSRRDRIRDLHQMADRGQWEELYARYVLYEFPSEARMGYQLAFLRPFADPDMAKILVAAGRVTKEPAHRAYDTGIVMYEIITGGLDDPRARQFLAHMNRMHHRYPQITQEQLSYVLAAFAVVPARYIDTHGWREQLDIEREAASRFCNRLGELMGIRNRFDTYEQAEHIVDQYEADHLGNPTSDSALLGRKTIDVIAGRLPRPLQPAAPSIFATQLGSHRVATAVGLPHPSRLAIMMDRSVVALRRYTVPLLPAPTDPNFTPGQPAGTTYPDGYSANQIVSKSEHITK